MSAFALTLVLAAALLHASWNAMVKVAGIKHIYSSDRSGIIWTEADVNLLKSVASAEVGHFVDLGAMTGLRQGDLVWLSWTHITDNAIMVPSKGGKSI